MEPYKILIVEDEAIVGEDLQLRLENLGYAVTGIATSSEEAIQLSRRARPDLALMDIKLDGDIDGIDTAAHLRQSLGIPVIYVTAYVDEQTLARAKATLPLGYIHKPFTSASLQAAIEIGIYKYEADETVRQRQRVLDNALQCVDIAMIATDIHGHVVLMNSVAETLSGWTEQQAVGSRIREVLGVPKTAIDSPFFALLEDNPAHCEQNASLTIFTSNGIPQDVEIYASPVQDAANNLMGAVLILHRAEQGHQRTQMKDTPIRDQQRWPKGREHQLSTYEQAITHAIGVLLETKGAFRSKALRQLRMDLGSVLRRQQVDLLDP